jgi:hypothetical protein
MKLHGAEFLLSYWKWIPNSYGAWKLITSTSHLSSLLNPIHTLSTCYLKVHLNISFSDKILCVLLIYPLIINKYQIKDKVLK